MTQVSLQATLNKYGQWVCAPAPPTITFITPVSTDLSIGFTLGASALGTDTITVYKRVFASPSNPWTLVATGVSTATPYTLTGLTENTIYEIGLAGVKSGLEGGIGSMLGTTAGPDDPLPYPVAFDYYIDPTLAPVAVETNLGTLVSPWTWRALFTKASTYKTHTIGILDGTAALTPGNPNSQGTAMNGANKNWIEIPQAANGTLLAPTVIAAVNPRKAVFRETSFMTGGGCYYMRIFSDNLQLRGIRFTHTGNQGIDVHAALNCVIKDCQFDDFDCERSQAGVGQTNYGCIRASSTGTGKLVSEGVRSLLVENNYFLNIYNSRTPSGGGTPFLDNDPQAWGNAVGQLFNIQGCIIRYNTANRIAGLGVPKRNTGNLEVYQNLVLESYVTGVYLLWGDSLTSAQEAATGTGTVNQDDQWATTPSLIHHNIYSNLRAFNNNTGEIGQNWYPTYMYNNTFIFNTDFNDGAHSFFIWNNGAQAFVTVDAPFPAAVMKFYNNIVDFTVSAAPTSAWDYTYEGAGNNASNLFTVRDYNCYSGFKSTSQSGNGTRTLLSGGNASTNFVTWSGLEAHSVIGAHGLLNPTTTVSTDYVPQGGAAALNAGKVGGVVGGAVCNIGAWDGTITRIGVNYTPEP